MVGGLVAPVEAMGGEPGGGDELPDGVHVETEATQERDSTTGETAGSDGRWLLRGAVLAAVSPMVVAAIRALARGWYPTGDNGFFALRAADVFTKHHPLLGTWSSASAYSEKDMSHPGPLHFDLLALPVKLLGPAVGVATGIALINIAAVVLIAWLVKRRAGPRAAALAMVGCALLGWSLGSEMLYDPWNLHSALFPFALFLVAAWCAVDGDLVALPFVALAGADILQLHLSYVLLVPALSLLAVGAVALRAVRHQVPRRSTVRWGALAALVALVCWSQPLYEQARPGAEGNLTRLANGNRDQPTAATEIVVEMLGVVAVPPAWLPPTYGSPPFLTRSHPTWLVVVCLVLLVGLLAGLGWRARQRGSPLVAAGSIVAIVAVAVGYVTLAKMPIPMGITATYTRFLWPLGMVVWLVVALGVADEVRRRWPGVRRVAIALPLAAAVVALATFPTVDHSGTNQAWAAEAIETMDDDLVRALRGKDGVVLEMYPHPQAMEMMPAVMVTLQDAGIPFHVRAEAMGRQVGDSRVLAKADAEWQVVVKASSGAGPAEGEREIASWTAFTAEDAAEARSLRSELEALIAEHGLPVTDEMRTVLETGGYGSMLAQLGSDRTDHADDLLSSRGFENLSGFLDPDVFPPSKTRRWHELQTQRNDHIIRIYLSKL